MFTGIVEELGKVAELNGSRLRISRDLMHLLVEKGSVTVDGISLTAFNLTEDTFTVAVIP
ncbi:MAG: riboflavin synthase, partial [Acidimicrobiaceae bacterium]